VHERLRLGAAEIAAGAMEDFMSFTDRRQEDDVTLFVMKLRARSAT
jgi:serine phosphatase RsbU (regulator of sigma subunit)